MANKPLTVWCNAKLPPSAIAILKAGTSEHRLILSDKIVNNLVAGKPDALLAEANIAFGQPDAGQVVELAQLQFIQLSSAGYARYDRQDLRDALKQRGAILCNSSAVYAEACAQHALAFILSGARQIPAAILNQQGERAWLAEKIRSTSHLLGGQTILIVGYGAIGSRLAELLGPLRMNIVGLRRRVRGDEAFPTRPMSDLDELLAEADHVVNILPDSEATRSLFNGDRFARMKRGAIFYNIGRGATVDQAALRAALVEGPVGAAYLDVMVPEPLAADDPLWTAPNCHITPHTAGGAADEFDRVVKHFLGNLERFVGGEAMIDRVF
jgi:phosphoglycerate dehydrogenase-like enzyme